MAKLTKTELGKRREAAVLDLARVHGAAVRIVRATVNFTCDGCENPEDCVWAFDSYNTSGDCLYVK